MRPEDHRPQRRVQPVGPDHQVEAPPVAAREGHVDPVRVLGEFGDPVAEDVLDAVAGVVVEHPGQVPAQDLDVRDEPVATVVVGTGGLQHLPVRVYGVRAGGVGARRAYRRVQSHAPDDLLGHPARVHRLPTGTQLGGPLHHGHLGPPPTQPVSQRGPRDARPRHQHPGTAHRAPRSLVRMECSCSESSTLITASMCFLPRWNVPSTGPTLKLGTSERCVAIGGRRSSSSGSMVAASPGHG
jgi:hypothetical protein